ncbi:YybH family protein [Sulfurirhabdus autotrophica]|uniref:Cds6 C-terminal domain-containing protein n=1 Tax=Sulfurirhabdus autotrophica TaxID=1706046 RepID=A0A4R3Y5B2_9PROT|nr:nuclear transport factor 2 family protein [Sulfurirhabdus autotrophica]TCV85343.1 hypothetical protein EDC63_10914 [Sulfurirhabdus autotrophica]
MSIIEGAMRQSQVAQHSKTRWFEAEPVINGQVGKPVWHKLLAVGAVGFVLGAVTMKVVLEPAKAVPLNDQQAKMVAAPASVVTPVPATSSQTVAIKSEKADSDRKEVLAAVDGWVKAWSGKNVENYVSAYAPNFQPSQNVSHAEWVNQRRNRIAKYGKVEIKLSDITAITKGDSAIVELVQYFKNDTFVESGLHKHLEYQRIDDQWKIVRESSYKS